MSVCALPTIQSSCFHIDVFKHSRKQFRLGNDSKLKGWRAQKLTLGQPEAKVLRRVNPELEQIRFLEEAFTV